MEVFIRKEPGGPVAGPYPDARTALMSGLGYNGMIYVRDRDGNVHAYDANGDPLGAWSWTGENALPEREESE